MASGLQCFDSSGNLTFTSEDRLARFIGSIAIANNTDGSTTVAGIAALGTVFMFFLSNGESVYGIGNPLISSSGDVISWSYGTAPTGMRSSGIIFYGVN